MEEHTIIVDGDVIVGNHSELGYGLIANSAILGERVNVSGDVTTSSDVRIDIWSRIGGNVKTGENAYLGEFVNISGKLVVKGDLDIGNDVKIDGGFEARGWIVVRNPVPVVVYIYLYIAELLRLGKDEEVEKALDDLFETDEEDPGLQIMIIPNGSRISPDSIRVPGTAAIGDNCRLVGNLRAEALKIGNGTTLYGSIRTAGLIELGENNTIHGNVVSRGKVVINRGTHVLGQINAATISIHESARVDGIMRAGAGISFIRDEENVINDNELMKIEIPEPAE
jgi:predicted acyltransferase (DUF342 family)